MGVADSAETVPVEVNANVDTSNPNVASVADVSAEIVDAIDAMLAASDIPEEEVPGTAAATSVATTTAKTTTPSTEPAPEHKPDPTSAAAVPAVSEAAPAAETRANERLASREAQIAEREGKLKEQEKTYATLGSKLRRGEFVEVFKALGMEDREIPLVIRAAMSSQLPADKRPKEYTAYAEKLAEEDRYRGMISEVATEAKAAKAELEEYKAMVAQQQAVAEYNAGVEKYLANGVAEEAPIFAKLLQADRPEALKRLYAVVQSDAAAKLKTGAGDVMSPADAAKAVEAELTKISTLLGTTNSTPPTKTAVTRPSLSTKAVVAARKPSAPNNDAPIEKTVDDWLRANGMA